jgi:hypothetical protein
LQQGRGVGEQCIGDHAGSVVGSGATVNAERMS